MRRHIGHAGNVRLIRFAALSLILHILILAGVSRLPEPEKKRQEFSARLVTPEEAARPPVRPAVPPPVLPPVPSPQTPKVIPGYSPGAADRVRPSPPAPYVPPPQVSPEPPVVPGEGSGPGGPHAGGAKPGDGAGKATGEGGKGDVQGRASTPGSGRLPDLFDPGVISGVAGKDTGAGPSRDRPVTFDTAGYRYAGYMNRLREKIQGIWTYPPEAAARGIYGDLKIRFTIRKDGRLAGVELVRTSGYTMLDEAAVRALKEGEPYWPLPDEWGMETYTILGHFIYSLYGYQMIR